MTNEEVRAPSDGEKLLVDVKCWLSFLIETSKVEGGGQRWTVEDSVSVLALAASRFSYSLEQVQD